MRIDHKILYNSPDIYRDYAKRDYLEPAEQEILDYLRPMLANMDMLDMGVGGGRTTKYFAPEVKSYIGADYASFMIKNCREKFQGRYNFTECDARNMKGISNGSFDFLLFSYNGIDSFNHNDRFKALREIKRVLRPGGYFYFSSHNLNWEKLHELFRFGKSITKSRPDEPGNPIKGAAAGRMKPVIVGRLKKLRHILRLSYLNRSIKMVDYIEKLRKNERGLLYDNSLNGKASVYYITRKEQLRQLRETGFMNIKTFSKSGIMTDDENELNKDGWIYYLCRADRT